MAELGVEAVERLQQAHRCDLQQVLEGLRGAAVAPGEAACERHEPLHQRFPRRGVAVLLPAHEQLARVLGRPRGRGGGVPANWRQWTF